MTEWFFKNPGDDLMPSQEREGEYLIADVPDWVKVPDHPGIPGGKKRVLGVKMAACPYPGHNHVVKHYELEGIVQVAECEQIGFVWYRKNESKTENVASRDSI